MHHSPQTQGDHTMSRATAVPQSRLVKIGSHTLRLVTASEWMELGEMRWHALHARALEMLDSARGDPASRVSVLGDIYKKRDETLANAVQWAATIEGAHEIIQMVAKREGVDVAADLDKMKPEDIMSTALQMLGIELAAGN